LSFHCEPLGTSVIATPPRRGKQSRSFAAAHYFPHGIILHEIASSLPRKCGVVPRNDNFLFVSYSILITPLDPHLKKDAGFARNFLYHFSNEGLTKITHNLKLN
jgi:hypothetical protein